MPTSCLAIASPKPVPPKRRVVGAVRLGERLENVIQRRIRNADARINDTHADLAIFHDFRVQLDVPVVREFYRVAEQVDQHLAQATRIAEAGGAQRIWDLGCQR